MTSFFHAEHPPPVQPNNVSSTRLAVYKPVDLSMQKTPQPYKKDKIIAKILLIKKPLNLVRTKKEKLKDIINKKTSYLKR